jgi:V8-like Glu-specific endopeptidase
MAETRSIEARLEVALEAYDREAIDRCVTDILGEVRAGDRSVGTLVPVAEVLRRRRRWDHVIRVAEAGLQSDGAPELWAQLVQALLDSGSRISADAVITAALACLPSGARERAEILGLAGRCAKDRYVASGDPDALHAAIAAYSEALAAGGDVMWLAVNVHALAHRGRRHGISTNTDDVPSTEHLMQLAAEAALGDANPWAVATWIECHLLVGLPLPVDAIVHRLGHASPFVHGSLRRQLLEIWELGETHPGVVTLAELILRDGTSGEIAVPTRTTRLAEGGFQSAPASSDLGFEKVFGTEHPTPIQLYRKGLEVAQSVCLLSAGSSFPAGTGFVIAGEHLHPFLAGRTVIVTNEHVVPRLDAGDGPRAEELTARFEVAGSTLPAAGVGGLRAVWWSPREDLDVTLMVSDELDACAPPTLHPARALPIPRQGAHVYVVGHPGGGGLQLSIRGNDLIDVDDTRLHYRTPTSRGSSGSPVFDHEWDLVGVHHYGSANLAALHGRQGRYEANQGTTIAAVRARLAEQPPQVPA